MSKILYPECFGESYLYNEIRPSGIRKPIHSTPGGIGWVFKQLDDSVDNTLIGIVDNDRSLPNKIDQYIRIDPDDPARDIDKNAKSKFGIKYYKHHSQNSYLIMQEPDLENWLCRLGKDNRLFSNNSTINTPEKMKVITKQKGTRLSRNKEFRELVTQIKALPDSPFDEIQKFIEAI